MIEIYDLLLLNPWALYIFVGLFSLAVGSFLNVVIYRLPLMLEAEWRNDCCSLLDIPDAPKPKLNLIFPRSFCPVCHHNIPSWHNIPVISYCLLRGRCRECRTPIPMQYPLVELLSFILSLSAAWQFGFGLKLLFVLPFIWILISLFFIDLKHQILPDCLTLSLLWLGLLCNTQSLFSALPNAVLSAAGAYMSLWLFIRLFYLITGKIGMGNGDFKLFAAFGAWFGAMELPLILLFSSFTGALVGCFYLKKNKKTKETPIPFGPFLCVAALIALFYGERIIAWYLLFL